MKLKCNSCSEANAYFVLYLIIKTAKHHSPFTLYAISTSPIVHPVCPPKVLHNLCPSFALAITVVPREIETVFMQFFWKGAGGRGANKVIMGDVQVASTSVITKYAN